ncbi:MAG: cysteine--tRNA ligase [Chloroflexi bacterium RBG_13_56_8]|nr:MAG: cysteine--tRNA ligase [Chloroflexi bacterium RBG_13_56_8]
MLKLYNEQSGKLEPFEPLGDVATIYVCGITPYDTTHVGHAFTYLSFDVLIRYWEYLGYQVRYVQNVTDIDDDILRRSKQVGEDWRALGNRWTRHFIQDMRQLNVRPPDVFPRATDVISEIQEAVQTLIDKGFAYVADGSVYYDVASNPDFGVISGLPKEQWLPTANERGNIPGDPLKRDPLDFVLWQAQKPGEPAWESPWGMGRPGWHIECSTMAKAYLGEVIDVHGGGGDLAFPHHECEAAQSCGVTDQDQFARFWVHTAMVRYQGEKMSKSLGNLVWVHDLLQDHPADVVRILLSSHPYYETWEYDAEELIAAEDLEQRLLRAATAKGGEGRVLDVQATTATFEAAMDDNLNTREALAQLGHLADCIVAAAGEGHSVDQAQAALRKLATVLGLRLDGGLEPRVIEGWDAHYRRFE